MTGNEYQKLAGRTINKNLVVNEQLLHSLHGMVGEVGEIHSIYQKVFQGHPMDETHLKKEVGDLLWFITEYCTAMGFDLDDVMETNINKLKARYPMGFLEENSLIRSKDDI